MMRTISARLAVLLLVVTVCAGCFGRGGSPSRMQSSGPVDDTNREQELRALIERVLTEEQTANSPATARLEERRPYHYREYVSYPNGVSSYELVTTESDMKSTPYLASITLDKERHATRLTKKRDNARDDDVFYASRGYETRTYELRHGRWRETGSVYIAQEGDSVPASGSSGVGTTQTDDGSFMRRLFFWRE